MREAMTQPSCKGMPAQFVRIFCGFWLACDRRQFYKDLSVSLKIDRLSEDLNFFGAIPVSRNAPGAGKRTIQPSLLTSQAEFIIYSSS